MAIFQNEWHSANAYTMGSLAMYSGVVYEALVDIAADTTDTPFDNTNWKVRHVVDAKDVYGITEAIRLELSAAKNDQTNDSIVYLMGHTQRSVERNLRTPSMLDSKFRRTQKVGDEVMVSVPDGLLEPLRLNVVSTTIAPSALSIKRCDPTEYRRFFLGGRDEVRYRSDEAFSSPYITYGYLPKGDDGYLIAPATLDDDTKIEFYGYYREPILGRSIARVNDDGDALNAANQTITQWQAAGNSGSTFVQAIDNTTENYFSRSAPDLLIYGTLSRAFAYIKDEQRAQYWTQMFQATLDEIVNEVNDHDAGTEEYISLMHGYPS